MSAPGNKENSQPPFYNSLEGYTMEKTPKRYRDTVALFYLALTEFRQNTEKKLNSIDSHLGALNGNVLNHAGQIAANQERSENAEKAAAKASEKVDENRKIAIAALVSVIVTLIAGLITMAVIAF